MRAIIFSDSHKCFSKMAEAIQLNSPVNMIIHAGDVHQDVEDLQIAYPKIPVAFVKGNNDPFLHGVPTDRIFTLGKTKIFLTHGHNYGVKYSTAALLKKACDLGADICIFGHTHTPYFEKINGVTLFNPGAASQGFGLLEADDFGFSIKAVKL